MTRPAVSLEPLEVASGLVFGRADEELPATRGDARAALEVAVLEALLRPPCLVSFSGGRDSSAVLAVAAAVARRESLPLPIPVTARFPDVATSREDGWQERVVGHLRLGDWLRLDFHDELDCLGPYARRTLLRHGLLWPFNTHFHVPLVEPARGGSLLTGIGGDELLGESRWARPLDVLGGRARPAPRDVRRLVFLAAPRALRRRWTRRRFPLEYGWLSGEARRLVVDRWAGQVASEPRLPRPHARWRGSFRYQRVGVRSLGLVAADAGVLAVHPFLDRRFRAAVVADEARLRHRTRTDAMRQLVGTLLPDDVVSRSTKSSFDGAFFSEPSRAFAAAWDGRGFDPAIVNDEALRAEWLGGAPDARSFLALQAAWLSAASGRQAREQEFDGVRQSSPVARPAQLHAR